MIRELSTRILIRIHKNLSQYNPDAGYNEFEDRNMDDLYDDVDFELASRKFLGEVIDYDH